MISWQAGPSATALPLFILSPYDRDVLVELAGRAGWRCVGARRSAGAEKRFLGSQAQVALVDTRGLSTEKGREMIGPLAGTVEASGGALVALTADHSSGAALLAAGATHLHIGEPSAESLGSVLLSARIMTERLGGGASQVGHRRAIQRSDALLWRHDAGNGRIALSPALAERLGLPGSADLSLSGLIRRIPRSERRTAIGMIRQAIQRRATAAFVHELPGSPARRVAHHIHAGTDGLSGEIELLPADASAIPQQLDILTGLANRTAALEWVGARLQGDEPPALTLILLSLGQFDRVNAAYGAAAGDALLGRIGRRIERLAGEVSGGNTLTARIAGTEFLVALGGGEMEEGGANQALFLARRLMGAVAQPFNAGDHLIRLTARCGLAEARPGDDAAKLLRRASAALVDARRSDGEGIRIRAGGRKSREVDDDRLETDLRLALGRGEIGIMFQPQYAMADDHIVGVEALARWNHPHYGPLSAGALFAAAERSDYLLPLSTHIQTQALRIAANWPEALSHLRLSVNVTAIDIAQPDFLEHFLAQVDESGFPRARLTVEITESGLIEELEAAATLLARLRAEGLAVAIDDFGTGYSSLAYLKSLPLDYLKIDSGLAKDITGSPRDRIIVRGIIDLAQSLSLKIIAEGIESEQQLNLLAREGCDYYQGFLRSPPVSSEDLAALMN